MIHDIHLTHERLWETDGTSFVRGAGFIEGTYHSSEDLLEALMTLTTADEFREFASSINGFFAAIHPIDSTIYIATDQIRSIPLYYTVLDEKVVVGTDDQALIEQTSSSTRSSIGEAEYILSGYVPGYRTFYDRVSQMQAGEIVSLTPSGDDRIARTRYYRYQPGVGQTYGDTNRLLKEMDRAVTRAFERLIEHANGRPIVVSLSAGYDSRLVLTKLAQLDYDPVIAFTYDYGSEEEVELCQEIATSLDIRWEHVSQSHEEWWKWYHSPEREHLDRLAGTIDAVPTLGPAIAIKKLHDEERIPSDSVFVTGDTASTTGEHIPRELVQSDVGGRDRLVDAVLSFHYDLWEWDTKLEPALRERIRDVTEWMNTESREDVVTAFEQWDWQERQSKHILRNYLFDFWGYDWWLPLWDREYMDFWHSVPVEHRYERSLHEEYVKSLYASVADISRSDVGQTFHGRNPWVSRIERLLDGTPLKAPVEQIYRERISPRRYEENPVWGIMRKEQFNSVHSGRQVVHAFRTLDVLGRMSFDPRDDGKLPQTGRVMVDTLEER